MGRQASEIYGIRSKDSRYEIIPSFRADIDLTRLDGSNYATKETNKQITGDKYVNDSQ